MTALVLIDIQKGFEDDYWGRRNNPNAEQMCARILDVWRERQLPVIHVKHCSVSPGSPLRPELPGNEFQDLVAPIAEESVFTKSVNSAFIGTGLQSHLDSNGVRDLVVVGLTTDHCVSTSVRMAANLGFDVTLISDATATFDRVGPDGQFYLASDIHGIHLASLNDEFCRVKSTDAFLLDR